MSQVSVSSAPDRGQLFLAALRSRTSQSHQLLEDTPLSQSITASDITISTYVRYLQVMQRVVQGLQKALDSVGNVPDIHFSQKLEALASDLEIAATGKNPFPPFQFSIPACSEAYAWGVCYVLEGSNLGGRVILKSLPQHLQLSEQHGASYFAGYGAETGRVWKSFIAAMCTQAAQEAAAEELIQGAEATFAGILQYFRRCNELAAAPRATAIS